MAMFFILSKTVGLLLRPSILLFVIGIIGLLLCITPWRRIGRRLAIGAFALLILLGVSPIAQMLGHALESRFPKWDAARGAPDGVVVLGGVILPGLSRVHGEPVVFGDAGRVLAIAKLAREFPNARFIYSGGDGTLAGKGGAEADYVPPLMDMFGVAPERVILEPRSRNTAENAAFSKQVAQPKPGERWLLVTSAQHMPRSMGAFRQAGFPVEAYPVAWRTGLRYQFRFGLNVAENLTRLDSAVNEWAGLSIYWLTGRSSALWPAP
jgi:uncharacterized SAM-binding protein YcdF (DUF218 family)